MVEISSPSRQRIGGSCFFGFFVCFVFLLLFWCVVFLWYGVLLLGSVQPLPPSLNMSDGFRI